MKKRTKSAPLTVLLMIVAMFISKLLGMFRGVLLAAAYGTTENATAFSAASRIPLSFFDIVFASAILGCFIPVYNSFADDENKKTNQNVFTSIYLNFILLLTGAASLLGVIFAEPLLELVAPGLLPETYKLAVILLRTMFPMIIFAAASYTFVGLLQSNGEYIVPSFISAISNLLIIVYFLFFDKYFGIKGLALAYTVAWFVQLLTLILPVIRSGYSYKLLLNFKNKSFITALKLTPSIMMGSWLSPVCLLLSMRFASYIGTQGAVPSFEYAINLFTVITGITTYGVCNYIFPKLSAVAGADDNDFVKTGRIGLLGALLMTVPISAIVFSLAPEGISIVYLRGSFDTDAASMVTLILRTLVPGMLGFTLVEFLSRTFYAVKKPKYVVWSVVVGILADALALSVLINGFSVGIGALGIAYSIGILASGVTMLIFSAIEIKGFLDLKYLLNIAKILLSGLISAMSMWAVKLLVVNNPYTQTFVYNSVYAILIALIGIIVYIAILLALRESTFVSIKKSRKKE